MPIYVSLIKFSQQGIATMKHFHSFVAWMCAPRAALLNTNWLVPIGLPDGDTP